MSDIRKILEYALAMEKKGAAFYREQAEKARDEEIKKLLHRLSEFEQEHVNYLQNKIDELEEKADISFNPGAISEEEVSFVSRKKEELDEESKNDLPIIRMAYLIEKDFHDFYKKAAQKTDGEQARQLLLELASWEEKHLNYLYKMYQQILQEFWFDMGFEPF